MSGVILLTPGDPRGIGPEITLKALKAQTTSGGRPSLVVIGAEAPFRKLRAKYELLTVDDIPEVLRSRARYTNRLLLIPAPVEVPRTKPFDDSPWQKPKKSVLGPSASLGGFQAGWSVELATRLVLSGVASALVTGPIHKERLQAGGYPFSGHTDLLGHLSGVQTNTMMLANEILRVALVTVHTALANVPGLLSEKEILRTIEHTTRGLQDRWGIRRPKIAITALNPHAGEGGLFGSEEQKIITPAIEKARKLFHAEFSGPHPADTVFAQQLQKKKSARWDAVICMYHDQGLIPVKLLDFPKTVNVTLGIPIIRTSVDHGTAFDIVGKNKADPSSLISAIKMAEEMVRRQKKKPASINEKTIKSFK